MLNMLGVHYLRYNLFVLVTILAFHSVAGKFGENPKERIDAAAFVSLPINSKFWNPQLDDKTNRELIGAEYIENSINDTDVPDKKVFPYAQFEGFRSAFNALRNNQFQMSNRSDRFLVWGLLNILKPMSWSSGLPSISLRDHLRTDINKSGN